MRRFGTLHSPRRFRCLQTCYRCLATCCPAGAASTHSKGSELAGASAGKLAALLNRLKDLRLRPLVLSLHLLS